MCYRILRKFLRPKTYLSSTALHKPSSRSALQPAARRRCQVCRNLDFPLTALYLRTTGHTSPILCASFSPTGNLLATGSGDCNARLWDLHTETPSHTLSGHKGWVLCVEWEAMERKLATGGHDGQVCPTCRSGLGSAGRCLRACFLKVRLWDPKTGKPIGDALKGHTKWVTSLSWEPIHL